MPTPKTDLLTKESADLERLGRQVAAVEVVVGERSQAEWTRKGFKKLDDSIIRSAFRSERVAMRFERSAGVFGAAFHGLTFTGRDVKRVEKAMAEHLATVESYAFTRYIHVDYERTRESTRGSLRSKHWAGGREDGPVSGIRLEFDVYDISQPFPTALYDCDAEARLWKRLRWDQRAGDWQVDKAETSTLGIDKDFIPFTEHRHATLVAIKLALEGLDSKLCQIFGEKVKDPGKLLDAFDSGRLLLPAATGKPRRAKGRS